VGEAYEWDVPARALFCSNARLTVTAGQLPPGLELSADRHVRGTPTTAGVFGFTLTLRAEGHTRSRSFTITIREAE
jgi:hypothetical protein